MQTSGAPQQRACRGLTDGHGLSTVGGHHQSRPPGAVHGVDLGPLVQDQLEAVHLFRIGSGVQRGPMEGEPPRNTTS